MRVAEEIELPELLNLQGAKQLHEALVTAQGKDVSLLADKVRHVGAQALQLMLVARSSWHAAGQNFSISGGSPDFKTGLANLGAQDLLQSEVTT